MFCLELKKRVKGLNQYNGIGDGVQKITLLNRLMQNVFQLLETNNCKILFQNVFICNHDIKSKSNELTFTMHKYFNSDKFLFLG